MKRTLLLGNGLNRTLDGGISWSNLLSKLGAFDDETHGGSVPFPILFEQLAAKRGVMPSARERNAYQELKREVAQTISGRPDIPGNIHYRFASLPYSNIITTNYDEIIESTYERLDRIVTNPGSSRNILKAYSTVDDIPVFHAHGNAKWPGTMCLGYEHYISLIVKIRGELYPAQSDKDSDSRSYLENLIRSSSGNEEIWPMLLFTTDVDIVGLGLSYSEIDLWWLLSLRASLFMTQESMRPYANEITYYAVKTKEQGDFDSSRLEILRSLDVNVVLINEETFLKGYEAAADHISQLFSMSGNHKLRGNSAFASKPPRKEYRGTFPGSWGPILSGGPVSLCHSSSQFF